jgi:hypothetical protein
VREPITIELPWLPDKKVCGNTRTPPRYQAAEKRRQREHGQFDGAGALADWRAVPKIEIAYEFHTFYKRDVDGLVTGMKAFQDGIADAGVVVNDGPDHVVPGPSTRVKAANTLEEKTVVTFQEVLT